MLGNVLGSSLGFCLQQRPWEHSPPPPSPPHTFMKQKPGTMNQLLNVTVIFLVPLSFGLEGSGYLDNCLL